MKSSRKRKTFRKGRWAFWFGVAFWIGFVLLSGLYYFAEKKLSKLVLGGLGESFSTRVYSAPFHLRDQTAYSPRQILTRLKRLNYKPSNNTYLRPGQFKTNPPFLSIYLRGFESPTYRQNALLVHTKIQSNSRWELKDSSGNSVLEASLEPELITELSGKNRVRRELAQWEDFPSPLIHAVVAAEDHKFFDHWGVRPTAILRALIHNIRSSGPSHGGSTITQQLAKNLFLTPKRTLRRKIVEAFLALYLEVRYSKEHILTLYLNHIYMGQDGPTSVAGMKAATKHYFGKDLGNLSLDECAILAGLIRSPFRLNPIQDPDAAKKRRDFILRRMLDLQMISSEEFFEATNLPIRARPKEEEFDRKTKENSYYLAEILRQLSPLYGEEALFQYGLTIYSKMDPLLQSMAQWAVKVARHQAAVVAIDPYNGDVRALVGGKNYLKSQYNRATQARRQPGSAFKPFVYGAAIEQGWSPSDFLVDELRDYEGKNKKIWTPRNFDDVYLGTVTVRQALAHSINAASVDLAQKISPNVIVRFARRMGIQSPLEKSLALALGAYEVSVLELVTAYAPFANGGFRVYPSLVSSVLDAEKNVIEITPTQKESVLDPALAYVMTSLLQSVVDEGTAKRLRRLGWSKPTAGKTGTTNDGKDAWFVGYFPDHLMGVWYGHDKARAIRAAGSVNALPIWAKIMKSFSGDLPDVDFDEPYGVVTLKIDPESGQVARVGCPKRVREVFILGRQPTEKCSLHPGGLKGWFKKLFGRKSNPKPNESP